MELLTWKFDWRKYDSDHHAVLGVFEKPNWSISSSPGDLHLDPEAYRSHSVLMVIPESKNHHSKWTIGGICRKSFTQLSCGPLWSSRLVLAKYLTT